jgi:hypothetical protein
MDSNSQYLSKTSEGLANSTFWARGVEFQSWLLQLGCGLRDRRLRYRYHPPSPARYGLGRSLIVIVSSATMIFSTGVSYYLCLPLAVSAGAPPQDGRCD